MKLSGRTSTLQLILMFSVSTLYYLSHTSLTVFPVDLPVVSLSLSEDISDISEGDQVSVSCVAAANPPASVMWYREGSGEIVSRQQRLTIHHIKRDQAGVYVCQANNSVGQSQPKKIDLKVQCK